MADRPRIIMKIIRNCNECPHGSYDSGGAWICYATNRNFAGSEAKEKVQSFCTLDFAPASITQDQSHG